MKRNTFSFFSFLTAIFLISTVNPLVAQQHSKNRPNDRHKEISELVSDLSASQKRRVDNISRESKERVSALRKEQKAVKDSISFYLSCEGDHSQQLYPLFDREAAIHVAISREMYAGKLRIDEVLSPEQRDELRKACSPKGKTHNSSAAKKSSANRHEKNIRKSAD